jgi:tripartite-type tricarboxylate transporter receptor subunit TctC
MVENITGANGVLALRRVAEVGGDPSRLFFATSSIAEVISAASADRQLLQTMQPVTITSTVPMVLVVRSSLGVKDTASFLARLKASPELTYGSAGIGNGTHMCAADLVQRLSATAIHIPFQGSHAAMLNLAGGHIDFATVGAGLAMVPNVRVTPIAVTTATRSSLEPLKDLPTVSESLLRGFEYSLWQAAFAPASWDRESVNTLHAALKSVLSQESIRQALSKVAAEVVASSPATVSTWVEREAALHARLASVIKKA